MDKNVPELDPVSEAMQRVLAAERDGVRAVALAKAEAEEIQAQARQGARNIRRRVNERIRRMQGAYTRATEAQLAEAEAAVEQWDTEMSGAEASLLAAEVQLKAMLDAPDEGAVKAAESQLKAAQQAVAEAQKQLDEASITAPFDGEIVDVFADEGDIITPAVPIIHLIDPTVMEIEIEVDEIDIAEVETGQRAIIEVDALPTLELEGEVIKVNRDMTTNIPGVFAAGDCTGRPWQIAKATGEGLIAVLSAISYLGKKDK